MRGSPGTRLLSPDKTGHLAEMESPGMRRQPLPCSPLHPYLHPTSKFLLQFLKYLSQGSRKTLPSPQKGACRFLARHVSQVFLWELVGGTDLRRADRLVQHLARGG